MTKLYIEFIPNLLKGWTLFDREADVDELGQREERLSSKTYIIAKTYKIYIAPSALSIVDAMCRVSCIAAACIQASHNKQLR